MSVHIITVVTVRCLDFDTNVAKKYGQTSLRHGHETGDGLVADRTQ